MADETLPVQTSALGAVEFTPWLESAVTQIWNVTERARLHHPNPDDCCLAVWMIHAPWVHPAWSWHFATLIYLRHKPGVRPAVLSFPEASHEFIVYAMDPSFPVDLSMKGQNRFLEPVSIVQQFTAENDAAALERVETLLPEVVAGRLSVEADGRAAWRLALRGDVHE